MSDETAHNEHIAKIATLTRVTNICVFLQPLLALIMCWDAATSAICRHVRCHAGTAKTIRKMFKKKINEIRWNNNSCLVN
jgi:hypothetical protein